MIDKKKHNIAYSGKWLVGSLLYFARYASLHFASRPKSPPQVRFRP